MIRFVQDTALAKILLSVAELVIITGTTLNILLNKLIKPLYSLTEIQQTIINTVLQLQRAVCSQSELKRSD